MENEGKGRKEKEKRNM